VPLFRLNVFFKLAILVFLVELQNKRVQKSVGAEQRQHQLFKAVQKQPKPYKAYDNANALEIC